MANTAKMVTVRLQTMQRAKINLIPDFIVFAKTVWIGLFGHIRFAMRILGPDKGVRTSPSKWSVLALKRDRIEYIQPPYALLALITGRCSPQPRLPEHVWVHKSNSRPKPGVTWGLLKQGVLTLKRDRIEHILPPHKLRWRWLLVHLVALSLDFPSIRGCTGQIPAKTPVWGGGLKNVVLPFKRHHIEHTPPPQVPLALIIVAIFC